MADWVEKLESAIRTCNELRSSVNLGHVAITTPSKDDTKTGWMEKKGLQRFFVLHEGMLRWYEVENINTKPKGGLAVAGCLVNRVEKVCLKSTEIRKISSLFWVRTLFVFRVLRE